MTSATGAAWCLNSDAPVYGEKGAEYNNMRKESSVKASGFMGEKIIYIEQSGDFRCDKLGVSSPRLSNLQGEIRRIKALDKIRADFKPFDALYSSCNSSGIFEAVTVIEIAGRHIKGNCVCKSKKDLMEFRADDYFLYEDTPENRGYFNTIMGCGKAREELQDKFEKEIGEIDEAIRLGCSSIKQIKKRS